MVLTLVSSSVARLGYKFTVVGQAEQCSKCSLRSVCQDNLKAGLTYKIVKIRGKKHPCLLLEKGEKVVVCDVKLCRENLTVKSKLAMTGVSVRFEAQSECREIGCANWDHCCPIGVPDGTKITIYQIVNKKMECHLGLDLSLVVAEPHIEECNDKKNKKKNKKTKKK